MIKRDDVYRIGTIGKSHGVKGEVSFRFDDDVFDRVDADYLVLDIDGILVPFFIEEYRFRGNETANWNTSIAGYHYGTIENCAVYGTISARLHSSYAGITSVTASGIARSVFEGGVIRGCMFKGTLKTSPKTSGGETNKWG